MHYLVFKDQCRKASIWCLSQGCGDNKTHRCDEHRNRDRLFNSDCEG